MFIQTEETPNPAALKFIPGVDVMGTGNAEFNSEVEAKNSPLAKCLFNIDGVQSVFLGSDFIAVTKIDSPRMVFFETCDFSGYNGTLRFRITSC